MKKRNISENDLYLYFIKSRVDENMFLHDKSGNYYEWKEGIDGAEIFTLDEANNVIVDPENDHDELELVPVPDLIEPNSKEYIIHEY